MKNILNQQGMFKRYGGDYIFARQVAGYANRSNRLIVVPATKEQFSFRGTFPIYYAPGMMAEFEKILSF
ncbi:hypothetical protein SAMN05444280_110115 [Tangfeifania diversioriginum]|uniref:Uncharacterized protein n=1 Tax=Tangfeifania diversioriginum TaxID=1168035 RepID=A0A1M6GCG1_9BACT|nr:hypothetical protein [Tangfeifania diversioriginum]SHJ07602.1 hypothetical protein SAMN05444280_110115 [Tangfeifania diversioriginum]